MKTSASHWRHPHKSINAYTEWFLTFSAIYGARWTWGPQQMFKEQTHMQRNRESNFPLVLFITVEAPCSRRFQHEQEMLPALNGFITITQQKRTLKSLCLGKFNSRSRQWQVLRPEWFLYRFFSFHSFFCIYTLFHTFRNRQTLPFSSSFAEGHDTKA